MDLKELLTSDPQSWIHRQAIYATKNSEGLFTLDSEVKLARNGDVPGCKRFLATEFAAQLIYEGFTPEDIVDMANDVKPDRTAQKEWREKNREKLRVRELTDERRWQKVNFARRKDGKPEITFEEYLKQKEQKQELSESEKLLRRRWKQNNWQREYTGKPPLTFEEYLEIKRIEIQITH